MGFLDNLENNLKALEGRDEADPAKSQREQARRQASRDAALRTAPNVERLKSSEFTARLLTACRTEGHRLRKLVRFTWLDATLRLETSDRRLDLVAAPDGVSATFYVDGEVKHTEPLDFSGDPAALAQRWLGASLLS